MGSHLKQTLTANIHRIREFELEKVNLIDEFDILQIVGEGWFGKILLVEHKATDTETVLKALPKPYTALKDFYREFHYGLHLGVHKNIITAYDVAFETAGFYVFSQEYAPLGDLTSNVSEIGIGELHTKRVAKQLAAALDHMHSRDLVHRDVKLDNILVFKSDFSRIKLCDFGETRRVGSVVLRRNEWLPYAAPEILEIATDGNYSCNTSHDVWQFGIVIFVCLTGCLPWQKAAFDDPRYVKYISWQNSTLPIKRQPKLFKLVSSKAQRFFKRYLEPRVERRPTNLSDVSRYLEDRWMSKGMEKTNETLKEEEGLCPSMYSFHSSPDEKNKLLFSLTQYGLETTVDRNAKKDRIRQWIQSSVIEEEGEEDNEAISDEENIKIRDNQNGPMGERMQHRGPIAENRVTEKGRQNSLTRREERRERRMSLLKQQQVKEYKPPVDPRIPLTVQKNPPPVSKPDENRVTFNPSSLNGNANKTIQSSVKKTSNGHVSSNVINSERKTVERRAIVSALPFKNVKILTGSPTNSSESTRSSDSSTIRNKINVQYPQSKVIAESNGREVRRRLQN
ncbi:serine/threonine-protein kinase SBK1-like [Sitophilus oryzae]|uniref:Serine/threonine-protein kinase SBK1-like n=1 Tax=Sitophilus oryzae TaxID=7048 RepID=A0A6J2YSG3_SITOR|nr:serine/threonine-protein kinase SBK1-like [Sitophilus oryzae]XP_030766252.1 serine/threonine-protein kinase SBK1-like [Sitophilus oryzae]XP_030766253.1 serine/threonine-protein kinase SBK1-like [Sitophilus oryzae]XP_030766254.1 serine/threonine-protein kinase SBK1-like [Sitophilus oryzae]